MTQPVFFFSAAALGRSRLETRVQVTMGPKHGMVVIEFATLEDLERIYRVMTEGSRSQRTG